VHNFRQDTNCSGFKKFITTSIQQHKNYKRNSHHVDVSQILISKRLKILICGKDLVIILQDPFHKKIDVILLRWGTMLNGFCIKQLVMYISRRIISLKCISQVVQWPMYQCITQWYSSQYSSQYHSKTKVYEHVYTLYLVYNSSKVNTYKTNQISI